MPQYLSNTGFKGTPDEFGQLEGVKQLDYIKTLLKGQNKFNGKPFDNAVDYYIGNFFPAALKLPDIAAKNPNGIIVEQDPQINRYKHVPLKDQIAAYNANKGLDTDKDGKITYKDMAAVLKRSLDSKTYQQALEELKKVKADAKAPDLSGFTRDDKGTKEHQKQYVPDSPGILDSVYDWLVSLVKKFAEPVCFNIKTSDYSVGIEYGRILGLALEEELNCKSCIYTKDNQIELVVEASGIDKQNILKVSNDVRKQFKNNTKKLNYDLKCEVRLKNSDLPELTFNKAASQYRMFQLKINGIK